MKTFRLVSLACCVLTSATLLAADNAPRVWTDNQGRKVEATFIKLENGAVYIQTAAGVIFNLPLDRLSLEDQELAKSLKPSATLMGQLPALADSATVAQASARIDQLVEMGWQRENLKRSQPASGKSADGEPKAVLPPITGNPAASDEQFVRRAYLDIVGRIPSYEETVTFTRSGDADKRAKLINKLLDSEGYVSHMYNYFAEMLRIKDDFERNLVRGTAYSQWVKQNLRENAPWDQMAYQMLTATGKMWSNGAAGYMLRDAGMPLDNLSYTLQLFLGTDVACAQCHDHPFADWTQRQFYEMAAFFGNTATEMGAGDFPGGDPGERLLKEAMALMKSKGVDGEQYRGLLGDVINANKFAVVDRTENRLTLPGDYKYKDGSPGEKVSPKLIMWSAEDAKNPAYLLASTISANKGAKSREVFARWATHPSNPRFAMTMANRLWSRAFGKALTPSVLHVDNPDEAYNPELIRHLAAEMVRLKFNLKEFQRIVFNTRTYQREATTVELPMGAPYFFQGPVLRRMTAEQAWDSYMTLLLGNPDSVKNPDADLYGRSMDVNLATVNAQTLLQKVSVMNSLGARNEARMGATLTDAGSKNMDPTKVIVFGNMKLMRASELEQPAPPGHFLREFGQSERFTIDGGSKDGSSPQVLMMMNGAAQKMLTSKDSLIARNMEKVKNPPDKVEVVFLSILNRHPNFREKDIARKAFAAEGEAAYGNIIWSLINGREFSFVQ
ncbi:DUF1549 domain-containing protein [Verrucomicrobium spinosum]|uniref:DUF1549 domain-containing protein n=2 Tax=Verrucomicrobium spinosum TaxID=2736 RepID=UPI0001745E42|nr:DUF1549 domain-containing protein [Verrucomicrobium spinosum]